LTATPDRGAICPDGGSTVDPRKPGEIREAAETLPLIDQVVADALPGKPSNAPLGGEHSQVRLGNKVTLATGVYPGKCGKGKTKRIRQRPGSSAAGLPLWFGSR